jgi:hypothetical protein
MWYMYAAHTHLCPFQPSHDSKNGARHFIARARDLRPLRKQMRSPRSRSSVGAKAAYHGGHRSRFPPLAPPPPPPTLSSALAIPRAGIQSDLYGSLHGRHRRGASSFFLLAVLERRRSDDYLYLQSRTCNWKHATHIICVCFCVCVCTVACFSRFVMSPAAMKLRHIRAQMRLRALCMVVPPHLIAST